MSIKLDLDFLEDGLRPSCILQVYINIVYGDGSAMLEYGLAHWYLGVPIRPTWTVLLHTKLAHVQATREYKNE